MERRTLQWLRKVLESSPGDFYILKIVFEPCPRRPHNASSKTATCQLLGYQTKIHSCVKRIRECTVDLRNTTTFVFTQNLSWVNTERVRRGRGRDNQQRRGILSINPIPHTSLNERARSEPANGWRSERRLFTSKCSQSHSPKRGDKSRKSCHLHRLPFSTSVVLSSSKAAFTLASL